MSEDTTSSPYTEEECADMIQCYLISGKKLELTQMCYAKRYPDRRKPALNILEKVVQEYLKSLMSNKTTKPGAKLTEDKIVRYFITNSHATVKKAASIFGAQNWYIEKLLVKRKAEIEAKRNENEEIRKQEQSSNSIFRLEKKKVEQQQETSDSEEETAIIKDELDSDESNIEVIEKESRGGVICHQAINSEMQDAALCSEASNIDTADNNLLCEIIRDETQDIGNCSETRSETDDDVICLEMEYTKKRKKKYSKRRGTKKIKTSEKKKLKRSNQDSKTLETSRMVNPIVYTTRLEEMAILHKKIKHLDNELLMDEILWESKPKYNYRTHKSNINVRRTMSFKLLKIVLKQLKTKENTIDLTDKVGNDNDLIKTDMTFSAEDAVAVGRSNKCNVVIVINNLFSNLCDIYVTDLKCNLMEYCCTKINNKYVLNQFDKTKVRLILNVCCWVSKQHKIESIWPRNECNFSRFLITKHKCPPNQCSCCCKPKQRNTEVSLFKPNDTCVTKSNKYTECLILNALRCKRPEKDTKENMYTRIDQKISPRVCYLFTEFSPKKRNDCQYMKNECVEIGSKQDIVRFHADNWRDYRQRCNQCKNITLNKPYHKVLVCCKWKRDFFLYEQFKACNISANTLRFLNGGVPFASSMCNGCKYNNDCKIKAEIGPKTNQSSNLVVDTLEIQHTRTSVKPTLLKISYKNKTPCTNTNINNVTTQQTPYSNININSVTKLAQHILRETKSAPMTSATETTTKPSTIKLNVTCNQIPGLDFGIDGVDYQLATEIVTKLTQMSFTVKEDLKIVLQYPLNIPRQTTSAEEFQILARMLLTTQNYLKCASGSNKITPGSDINLVAKIITPSGLETNNNRQSHFNIVKIVNNDTVAVGGDGNDIIVKPTELAILKVLEAFKNSNFNKPTPQDLNVHKVSNTNLITNKNLTLGDSDIIEILHDPCSNQSTINRFKNKELSSTQTFNEKNQTLLNKEVQTKGWDKNLHKNKIQVRDVQVASLNFSSDTFGSDISDINYDAVYTSSLKPYDSFANVIRCNKKCYTQSFKSYLNDDTETTSVVLPKISNVFSLQSSAQQTQKETNEAVPSTSKAADSSNNLNIETLTPLPSYNDSNIQNNLNAYPPFSAEQLMLYDPNTRLAQMVRLTPKGLLEPADYVNTITPLITQNIFPAEPKITTPENNTNIGVLTPTNQICDGKMTFMPVALQPVQEHCILPDIINDIPKNIDAGKGENDKVIVKEEADDVVVLDSD